MISRIIVFLCVCLNQLIFALNIKEEQFEELDISQYTLQIEDINYSVSNGVLNVAANSTGGDQEFELFYSVDSSMTSTGILNFTVLAHNSANVTDGGTYIDEDGDISSRNKVECGIVFNHFLGDGSIYLVNLNGNKSIKYYDINGHDGHGFLNVDGINEVYLRISYNFSTSTATSYYSIDGINFIALGTEYAPNDNFIAGLAVESRNVEYDQGDVYFDNFVIAEDMNYDSTLTDDPYSAYEYLGSSGEFIIYDDFNSADLNTENWGTLAWNGGELPYVENNRVHFFGSQNANSNLQGTLKNEYESLGLPEMDSYANSVINFKDTVLQNVHGLEFEFIVSSSFQNDDTGLGFFCYDDFPNNYGFFMDAYISSSNPQKKLQLEIGIIGNDILPGDSRFAYISEESKAGYLSFTEIQYDIPYKIAYILKDDILHFYLDGVEIGQIAYDSSRVHTLALLRGTGKNPNDYSGYIDDVKTYREFLDNDGDGLHNDDETNTGTFLSLRDTGTDPNDPDSDDDTLLDGAEIISHLTNPNLSDSDSDGLSDSIEINLYSSNPNSSDSDNDGLSDLVEANLSSINFDINSNDSASVQTLKENGFLTVQDIHDIRPGSTMIEVSGNQATVQLQMEESSDLQTWEDTGTPATMTIPADTDIKFFRFKMTE